MGAGDDTCASVPFFMFGKEELTLLQDGMPTRAGSPLLERRVFAVLLAICAKYPFREDGNRLS